MEDASRQPVRPASRSGGSAPRRRRSTVGAFGDLSQLVKKAAFDEGGGDIWQPSRLAEAAPAQETADDSAAPPEYSQACQICNYTPITARRGVYAQGVAKGEMHKVYEQLTKEREQRIKAQAKVVELRKEVELLQQAMADLRKASADMNSKILGGSDMAAQYAERERLLSMEFERQLERERQKKLKAKEAKRLAEEAALSKETKAVVSKEGGLLDPKIVRMQVFRVSDAIAGKDIVKFLEAARARFGLQSSFELLGDFKDLVNALAALVSPMG